MPGNRKRQVANNCALKQLSVKNKQEDGQQTTTHEEQATKTSSKKKNTNKNNNKHDNTNKKKKKNNNNTVKQTSTTRANPATHTPTTNNSHSRGLLKKSGSHGYLTWGPESKVLAAKDVKKARVVGQHHWATSWMGCNCRQCKIVVVAASCCSLALC